MIGMLNVLKFGQPLNTKVCPQLANLYICFNFKLSKFSSRSILLKDNADYINERENYIKEVCSNFNQLSNDTTLAKGDVKFNSNKSKKLNIKMKGDMHWYLKEQSKTNTKKNVQYKNIISKNIRNPNTKFQLRNQVDWNVQKQIDELLNEKNEQEACDLITNSIKENKIPNFLSLKQISSWLSKQGNSTKIEFIQKTLEENYPKLYQKEYCFEHYSCEALFREGQHQQAFSLLNLLLLKYPGARKIKETAGFIMRLVPDTSEEIQKEAFKTVKQFILLNEYKPAVILWCTALRSNQSHLHCLAQELLEENSNLLNGEEKYISIIITEATASANVDLLHRLIEIFMKLELKEPLSQASSALLEIYCSLDNVADASEVIKFATEEDVKISPDSVQHYLYLLNKKKATAKFPTLDLKYRSLIESFTRSLPKFKF